MPEGGASHTPLYALRPPCRRRPSVPAARAGAAADETRPVSTGGGTRRIQLVRESLHAVSTPPPPLHNGPNVPDPPPPTRARAVPTPRLRRYLRVGMGLGGSAGSTRELEPLGDDDLAAMPLGDEDSGAIELGGEGIGAIELGGEGIGAIELGGEGIGAIVLGAAALAAVAPRGSCSAVGRARGNDARSAGPGGCGGGLR